MFNIFERYDQETHFKSQFVQKYASSVGQRSGDVYPCVNVYM